MPDALPTADQAFGAAPAAAGGQPSLPTADDAFGPAPQQATPQVYSPKLMPAAVRQRIADGDAFLHVFKAAGQGAAEGWSNQGISADVAGAKAAWDRNINVGPLRLFNQAVEWPALGAYEALSRTMGAIAGGITKGAEQAGTEVGGENLGREAGGIAEWMMTDASLPGMAPHVSRMEVGPDGVMRDNHVGPVPDPAAAAAQSEALAKHFFNPTEEPLRVTPPGEVAGAEGARFQGVGGTGEPVTAAAPFQPADRAFEDAGAVINRLYHEDGILPAEVFHDAQRDPSVLADLAQGKKPERYAQPPEEVPVQASVTQRLAALGYDKPAAPRPQNLLSFMREGGGLQEEAGNLKGIGVTSRTNPGLISKKGMQLDYAREKAVEAGYLPEDATVDDLLQALKDGKNVFREADRGAVEAWQTYDKLDPDALEVAHAERAHFDGLRGDLERLGEPDVHSMPDEALQDRLEERLANIGAKDPAEAERIIAGQMDASDGRLAASRQEGVNNRYGNLTIGEGNEPPPAAPGRAREGRPEPVAEPQRAPEAGNQPRGNARPGAAGNEVSGRSQLLKPVAGTGDLQTRGLAEGIEAKAIERGLTAGFGDLPEYRTVSMKEQAAAAADLIAKAPELAKAIAMGQKPAPRGLLPESVLVAVEKQAIAAGDVETLRDLATQSRLSVEATTMGQRIRTLGERDPTSPVAAIQAVQDAREAALKGKLEAEVTRVTKEAGDAIKAARSTKNDWAAFVDSIMCR